VNRDYITRDRRLGELMTNIVRLALRPRSRLDGRGGTLEFVFAAELHWTRYDDLFVLDDEALRRAPDTFAGVGQFGLSWDR
jgi:hypothetical protein